MARFISLILVLALSGCPQNDPLNDPTKETKRVLSLDGGGILGIMEAALLQKIEEKTGKRAYQLFDLIGGASTGGILALGRAYGKSDGTSYYYAKDLKNFYSDEGPNIFHLKGRYASKNGENPLFGQVPAPWGTQKFNEFDGVQLDLSLQKKLGKLSRMSEAVVPVFVPVFDPNARQTIRLFSVDAKKTPKDSDCPIWQAARATSTVPGLFSPAEIKFDSRLLTGLLDGGIVFNLSGFGVEADPSYLAYTTAKEMFPNANIEIYSIGAGQPASPRSKSLGKVSRYYRLNPTVPEIQNKIDDASPEHLKALLQIAEEYSGTPEFANVVAKLN